MFKTLIIERGVREVNELKKLLLESSPKIDLIGSATDLDSAFTLIKAADPELVLIDITMPKGENFKLLEKLSPFKFEVIFFSNSITASNKAINFMPIALLLKPIVLKDFQLVIQKAIDKISDKYIDRQMKIFLSTIKSSQVLNSQKIAVPTLEGFLFLELYEIVRCEANGAYTNIYTSTKQKIVTSKNIKEYEAILPSSQFFRVHNSHLVNINRMLKYNKGRGGTVTMEDGTEIEVASRRRAEFLSLFQ